MSNFFPPQVSPAPLRGSEKMHWCYKELKDKENGLVVYKYGNYAYETTIMKVCETLNVTPSEYFVYLNFNVDKALKLVLNVIKPEMLYKPHEDIRSSIWVQPPLLNPSGKNDVEIGFQVVLAGAQIRMTMLVPANAVDYEG